MPRNKFPGGSRIKESFTYRTSFFKEIGAHDPIPTGYGVCYRYWDRPLSLCAPIPLNWIVGWWHKLSIYLRRGPTMAAVDAYVAGYELGKEQYFDLWRRGQKLRHSLETELRSLRESCRITMEGD